MERTVSVPSEQHPEEQGLKQLIWLLAFIARRPSEQHPEEQGLKLHRSVFGPIETVLPSEQHPEEQGLKLSVFVIIENDFSPSEQHPEEQGLKHIFLAVSSSARTPSEQHPEEQGLKLGGCRGGRLSVADRASSIQKNKD